jgi:hypothetical protein
MDEHEHDLQALFQYADQFAGWLAQDATRWEEIAPHLMVVNQAAKEQDILLWTQGYQSALVLQAVAAQAGFSGMAGVFERAARRFVVLLQSAGAGVN